MKNSLNRITNFTLEASNIPARTCLPSRGMPMHNLGAFNHKYSRVPLNQPLH